MYESLHFISILFYGICFTAVLWVLFHEKTKAIISDMLRNCHINGDHTPNIHTHTLDHQMVNEAPWQLHLISLKNR